MRSIIDCYGKVVGNGIEDQFFVELRFTVEWEKPSANMIKKEETLYIFKLMMGVAVMDVLYVIISSL